MGKKLAIQGHPTRGNEVVELLEMLGGKNEFEDIRFITSYILLFIDDNYYNEIGWDYIGPEEIEKYKIFTLEEFLGKYPFKVGDKVERNIDYVSCFINDMRWNCDRNCVEYHLCSLYGNDAYGWHIAECFNKDRPNNTHKNMEERKYFDLRLDVDQDDKLATEVTIDSDKIIPPKNYLIGKITKVDNGMLVEFVKKQPQYPKTYEECYDEGNTELHFIYVDKDERDLYESFIQLIRCRNAYWEIAGEEMSLGKPWEPKHEYDEEIFFIYCDRANGINKGQGFPTDNFCLVFPSAKMRDAFFENFKDLIEQCKELL